MTPTLATHQTAIAAICRRFHVARLDVFGSAARASDFDPLHSDIDLLVEFEQAHSTPALADFLALRDALEDLLDHEVDLAMASAIRNPYLRAEIDAARETLHAA